jgi:hypothetical protein
LESIIYLKHEINYNGVFLKELTFPGLKNEIATFSKKIKNMMKEIKTSDYSEDLIKSEMIYLYILGRYYVVGGEYDKFKKSINEMIENAEKPNNYDF